MKKYLLAGAVATMAMPAQATTLTDIFDVFFVVGDSLSDNENTATLLAPPPLPIAPATQFDQQTGVASNGFTWAKDFTDEFGANGFNLSFAAARARTTSDLVPDLTQQLTNTDPLTFPLLDITGDPVAVTRSQYPDGGAGLLSRLGDGSSRELVTFFVGGNDFRDAFSATDPGEQLTILSATFAAIQTNMFAALGAGVQDFVLMNIPDFTALPGLNMLPPDDPTRALLTATITEFNNSLFGTDTAPGLTDFLRLGGATVTEVDIFALLSDPEALGTYGPDFNTVDACIAVAEDEGLASCDGYLFWDDIHPTRQGHQLIAQATRDALAETYGLKPVPLPAPALMLITALGGIAALRRRKADA